MAVDLKHEGLLVRIPESHLPDGFDPDEESFSLVPGGADLLLLRRRKRSEKPNERQVPRLWGDVAATAVPDILLLPFLNRLTGMLAFDLADAKKTVYYSAGEIVFAQSSLAHDRLGETLVRMGKISDEQLHAAARQITADRKLGKILVESKLISAKDLFDGVRRQTLDIIASLFHYREGKFVFWETSLEGQNVVSLQLETREVLIDGMLGELGLGRDTSADQVFPAFRGRVTSADLNGEERQIFSLIADSRSLAAILEQSGLGEMQTLRVVFQMARRGLISFSARQTLPTPPNQMTSRLERTVMDFNSIFMDVFSILQAKIRGVDILGRMNSFFENMPDDVALVFQNISFLDDGSLPLARVLDNLNKIQREDRLALAVKAFNELLYFTIFEMKNFLSRDDAERLMEIVQNMELF